MTSVSTEQTLGSLACLIPGATRLFRQYKLDFCCGGDTPLRDAAARRELDAQRIADELTALGAEAERETDWRNVPSATLIDHLLERFHERHREQFPELIRLASRVEQVHGNKPDCPAGLAEHLWACSRSWKATCSRRNRYFSP